MPLTDLRSVALHHALRYTSRFGLNRSQGNYFYQIVQKSPPGTYFADLEHVSQPSSTSLLGRLLREACGTLPHLTPQEPVCENTQSRHAWYDYGRLQVEASIPCTTVPSDQKVVPPASNDPLLASVVIPIQEPASPPGFATLPPQLPLETPLGSSDTCQYPHPYGTNTQSSFMPTIDGSNLPPQYLYYYSNGAPAFSEPIQQDDMDCLPPSPFLSSDVDMDILTDTPPAPPSYDHTPWTQWIPIPEYVPRPVSTCQTPLPFSANQCCSGFAASTPLYIPSRYAARDHLPMYSSVSAVPEPPVDFSHLNFSQIQDTAENDSPHHAGTSYPTPIATLLDKFERSLTLVVDETPSLEVDSRSNCNRHPEPQSACIIEDDMRIALEPTAVHPPLTNVSDVSLAILDRARLNVDDSELSSNSVSDADGNTRDDSPLFETEPTEPLTPGECFLNVHDPSPRSFERESTEPLEDSQSQPPGNAPLAPPRFDSGATEPLEEGEDQTHSCFLDQPRRHLDRASLPTDTFAEAPVTHPAPRIVHPLAPRPPTPPCSRRLAKRRATNSNSHQERAGVPAGKRASGDARVSRCGREEGDAQVMRTKRTRFVVPDAEGDGAGMSTLGSPGPRRTTVTGPPRSILRNARATAMPYQKAGMRHAARRASVP